MRKFLPWALVLALFGNAAAYDIDQLRNDSKAYHDRLLTDLGTIRIEQEGEMLAKVMQGSMHVVMMRKGDRWRSESSMQRAGLNVPEGAKPMESIQLFDGKDLWQSAMGSRTKLQGISVNRNPSLMDVFSGNFLPSATIAGDEKLGERDCWIVDAPRPSPMNTGEPEITRTWVDKKTFAWVKTETMYGGKPRRTIFSDFRSVKGYELPYVTEMFVEDHKTMSFKIVKFETNLDLADGLFDPEQLPGKERSPDMSALMKKADELKAEALARKAAEEAAAQENAAPQSAPADSAVKSQ